MISQQRVRSCIEQALQRTELEGEADEFVDSHLAAPEAVERVQEEGEAEQEEGDQQQEQAAVPADSEAAQQADAAGAAAAAEPQR